MFNYRRLSEDYEFLPITEESMSLSGHEQANAPMTLPTNEIIAKPAFQTP